MAGEAKPHNAIIIPSTSAIKLSHHCFVSQEVIRCRFKYLSKTRYQKLNITRAHSFLITSVVPTDLSAAGQQARRGVIGVEKNVEAKEKTNMEFLCYRRGWFFLWLRSIFLWIVSITSHHISFCSLQFYQSFGWKWKVQYEENSLVSVFDQNALRRCQHAVSVGKIMIQKC